MISNELNNKDYFSHATELLYTLTVGEIMEKNVITVSEITLIKDTMDVFKKFHITGCPVVNSENILVGIISMSDILDALYQNKPLDLVKNWMTTNVYTIHPEVNIVKALDLISTKSVGRIPVIDYSRKVIGIITNGIILKSLLLRVEKFSEATEKEAIKLASALNLDEIRIDQPIKFKWELQQNDFENAGKLSSELKKILAKMNIDRIIVRRISIATYEAEINILIHSVGGYALIDINSERIHEEFIDFGPGIPDIEKAMEEGYSTASQLARDLGFGAGMGLPNIKKSVDIFNLKSSKEEGTKLIFEVYFDKKH
ncbi:MAG TPA: CBS domain-containing protein [Exilispira sp.]|nr:CBS domain-containing protein [Exilispira sp.]